MRRALALFFVCTLAAAAAADWPTASSPTGTPGAPASQIEDRPNPHFLYRFTPGGPCRDMVKFKSGAAATGKALEWGTLVHVYDPAGNRHTFNHNEIDKIEFQSTPQWQARPAKPDLTVAYVERLPRDPGWHGKVNYELPGKEGLGVLEVDPRKYPWHPSAGQDVKFIVHVKNAGGAAAKPFGYRVAMDDQTLKDGRIDNPLEPGAETTFEVSWKWPDDKRVSEPHYIRVELDTGNVNDEIAKWNNTFVDAVRAQTFFFCVSRNVMDEFAKCRNLVDTFSFEDWAQYHVHTMNWLFEHSVYPAAPAGIRERVRIDKIIVVDDARDENSKKQWEPQRHRGGDVKDVIEYGGNWEFGKLVAGKDVPASQASADVSSQAAKWAGRMDWGLPHELGHQLGLIDIYRYNTETRDCLVQDAAGHYIQRHHFFPWPSTMMHWHGPHLFSEVDAGYLNKTLGRPRGYYGDGQYAVPKKCLLEVRGNDGKPIEGVSVEIYQRQGGRDEMPGFISEDKLVVGSTDPKGRFELPNRPAPKHETVDGYTQSDNPFGKIDVTGGNGLLMARLSKDGATEYYFLRIFDFNVAGMRGQRDEYVHVLQTRFAPKDAPQRVSQTRLYFEPDMPAGRASFRWPHWGAGSTAPVREYRVYMRTGNGGEETKPWTVVDVVKPNPPGSDTHPPQPHRSIRDFGKEFHFDGFYSRDNWIAMTTVGLDGRESALSEPIFVPQIDQALRIAVDTNGIVYIPVEGNPDTCMLICDKQKYYGGERLEPYGLRVTDKQFGDYRPRASGCALDEDGLLVVADAWNHQIAWYERGKLVRLIGKPQRNHDAAGSKTGEFTEPSDVAIDGKGRVYVADRGNHRIQVFDKGGKFLYAFGTKGQLKDEFNGPMALGYCSDRLAVTDYGNKRLVLYDVSGDRAAYLYPIENLRDPDRGVVTPSRNVFVCDQDAAGEWGLVQYGAGMVQAQHTLTSTPQHLYHRPRGLYIDKKGDAFTVNNPLPYHVCWMSLE